MIKISKLKKLKLK